MVTLWFWALGCVVFAWVAFAKGDLTSAFLAASAGCMICAAILTVRAPRP